MDDNNKGVRFFDESMVHPEATALDAPRFIEFDWDEVFRHFGESEKEVDGGTPVIAQHLAETLRFLIGPLPLSRAALPHVGYRAVALAWATCPEIIEHESFQKIKQGLGCESQRWN